MSDECMFAPGVECKRADCRRCGLNPKVAKKRIEKFKEERSKKDEKVTGKVCVFVKDLWRIIEC